MEDELVLLTSYFNLAGGRRQDTADTFRVDPSLPSATSPDGAAALYVVTEASAAGQMGPRARRLAADTVAWEYSTHGEDQPAVRLKGALRTAHEEVLREFDGHVSVGMTVIAVEENVIYLAQVAPAQIYVLHDGGLHSMPATTRGTSPFARALGSSEGPQISVFRDEIQSGDVLALCSSWFNRTADADDLRECFGGEDADEIAECLLDLAKQHDVRDATAIVIEVALESEIQATDDTDRAPGFLAQVDMAVQALAGVGRMLLSELQPVPVTANSRRAEAIIEEPAPEERPLEPEVALAVAEPVKAEPERSSPIEEAPATTNGYSEDLVVEPIPVVEDPPQRIGHMEQATDEVPIVSATDEPMADLTSLGVLPVEAPVDGDDHLAPVESTAKSEPETPAKPAEEPPPLPEPPPVLEPLTELEQVNSRLQNSQDMASVIPPVQAFPDTSTEPSRIYATSKDIQAVNKRPRRFGNRGIDPLSGPPVIRPGMADLDLRNPVSRPNTPAVLWFSTAVVFCLIAGAFYVWYKHHHVTHVNPYPAVAVSDINKARSASTLALQDRYLTRARTAITLAKANGTSPTQVQKLNKQWLTTSDSVHHISREYSPTLLVDFSKFPNARPTSIASGPGLVFVLDPARKSVFSVSLTGAPNPVQMVQTGETYSGITIGAPVQVAADGQTALVLDDHNTLFRDTAGTKTATTLVQTLQTAAKVVSMTTLDPDVYILDTANSQVWRYPYAVSGFNPTASAYFTPNTPDLTHSVSLAFDPTDMFILKSDGTVLKYDIQANPQKFTVDPLVHLKKPSAIFTEQGLNYVWVADPGSGQIFQLDKSGKYIRAYVSGSSRMDLSQLKSFSVGPDGNTMYALVGSRLYDFPAVR